MEFIVTVSCHENQLSLQMSFHADSYWQILVSAHEDMILIEYINYFECVFRILLGFLAF